MIAAMMTAANLGARTTGWGFVVFTVGSIGWTVVGLTSGQTNLVATNGFLTLVNLVGVWRWLGRQKAYEDGGKSAESASRRSSAPTLFTATGLAGMPVDDWEGRNLGHAVEGLVECKSGAISYVVVSSGSKASLGEQLRPVPSDGIQYGCDRLRLSISDAEFQAIAPLQSGDWPASPDSVATA